MTRVEVSPTDPQYILIYGSTSNTSQRLLDGALDLSLVIDQFRFRIMRETDLRGVLWDQWPLEPGKDFLIRVWRDKYLRFFDKYMSILTLFSDYEGSGKLKEQMCIKFKLPPPTPTT
ncbi:uncharacterized protein LOC18020662 isoform X2 [Eutrema salsugineum]|nr:uncharacterized protein LOC18020662 isoform X2 [Eutrema salsugineum]XP_024013333.1 uncharacterized protein LOC18020662 isoform X2 [Eutrema salsugineum]